MTSTADPKDVDVATSDLKKPQHKQSGAMKYVLIAGIVGAIVGIGAIVVRASTTAAAQGWRFARAHSLCYLWRVVRACRLPSSSSRAARPLLRPQPQCRWSLLHHLLSICHQRRPRPRARLRSSRRQPALSRAAPLPSTRRIRRRPLRRWSRQRPECALIRWPSRLRSPPAGGSRRRSPSLS